MRKTTNDTGYIRKVFYSEKDKCWVAIAPEIPGCSALGDTDNKALQELGNAIKLHIQIRKKNKLPIPQALSKQKLGGRFLLPRLRRQSRGGPLPRFSPQHESQLLLQHRAAPGSPVAGPAGHRRSRCDRFLLVRSANPRLQSGNGPLGSTAAVP